MRVFVTGASGWIGSATIPEVLAAGHEVIGLARSDDAAAAVRAAGAEVLRGDLDDLDILRNGAAEADAVIHLGFKHDFSDYAASGRTERVAVATMADALVDSGRAFLFASGLAGLAPGRTATENDANPMVGPDSPRGGAENFALEYVDRGVRVVPLRFAPTVHGEGDHGFTATLANIASQKGVAGYVADGSNRWAAANRLDVARMIALALEKAPSGAPMHGVGEEGIATREIAEAIGRRLGVPAVSIDPADAAEHFGWIGMFFGMEASASSTITQETLAWTPTHPTLIDDIEAGYYTPALAERG